jgi:hypothetical protein
MSTGYFINGVSNSRYQGKDTLILLQKKKRKRLSKRESRDPRQSPRRIYDSVIR